MIIIKIINKSATAPTQTQKVINGVKPIDEANFSINSLITFDNDETLEPLKQELENTFVIKQSP